MSGTLTDALDQVRESGVRICWVTQLGKDGVYLTAYRVLLLDSALSSAAALSRNRPQRGPSGPRQGLRDARTRLRDRAPQRRPGRATYPQGDRPLHHQPEPRPSQPRPAGGPDPRALVDRKLDPLGARCDLPRRRQPVRTGNAPAVLAAIRNIVTTVLRLAGEVNIAAARRAASLDRPASSDGSPGGETRTKVRCDGALPAGRSCGTGCRHSPG